MQFCIRRTYMCVGNFIHVKADIHACHTLKGFSFINSRFLIRSLQFFCFMHYSRLNYCYAVYIFPKFIA